MKAAIYARVSTDKQGRDQTVDSQLDALRRWATAHGHELKDDHVYIDEGYSGARLDRPALDRLRDAAREGEFDVLGVYSPDRLARRYAYQVLLLEELRKAACDVEFIERPISDDPHDQLLLQIQGAIAEYERAVLGERFRRGKLQKARAGHWVAGQAPYGYRYVPKRDGVPGHLEVDEAEAEVVRMLYRWLIDERMTVRQILKRLAAGPWRPRNGKRLWSNSVVHRILSDPLYAGTAYANRHVLVAPRRPRSAGPRAGLPTCRKPRPREEWIPIPVPAIIDAITYQDASEQLARNSALSFRNNTRNDYLLRCLLTCRTCGLAMCGVTTQRGRRAAPAPLLHVPRQGHPRPGPGVPLPAAPAQGRGARRGRLGPRQAAARRPGHAGRAVRGAGQAGRRARRRRATRRARSGRPSCAGSTARSSGCSTPTRPRRSTSTSSSSVANRSEGAGRCSSTATRPGATAALRAPDGEGGLGRPDGVLRAGAVAAR